MVLKANGDEGPDAGQGLGATVLVTVKSTATV